MEITPGMMRSQTRAPQRTLLQPIDPSAIAYRWDGAGFRELVPGDELRQFPGGYRYLVCIGTSCVHRQTGLVVEHG